MTRTRRVHIVHEVRGTLRTVRWEFHFANVPIQKDPVEEIWKNEQFLAR